MKPFYKSQNELQQLVAYEIQQLLNNDNKNDELWIDTNIESFRVFSDEKNHTIIRVERTEAPRDKRHLLSVTELLSSILKVQRIDNISMGDKSLYKYEKHDHDEIVPGIFLGSAVSAGRLDLFDHVINCSDNIKRYLPVGGDDIKSSDHCYVRTGWRDDVHQRLNNIDALCDLIHYWWLSSNNNKKLRNESKPSKGILIHCEQGVSRSAALSEDCFWSTWICVFASTCCTT